MTEKEIGLLIAKSVLYPGIEERLLDPNKRAALLKNFDLDSDEVKALMKIRASNLHEFAQACIENGLVKKPLAYNPEEIIEPSIAQPFPKPSPRQK